ncbi:MAG: oligosaccharide flippase family protein [Thermoleophilia bacterium]
MSLEQSAISGVKWSSTTQVARMATQWVTIAILARMLTPNDFGLIGIAMVFVGFLTIFRDLGTSASIIQQSELSESLLSSLFWVNACFGLVSSIALYFFSSVVSVIYNNPEISSLLKLLSLTFLVSGLGIIHRAILERNLKFNRIAFIEIVAIIFGSITGIVTAFLGFGVWSLVYQVMVAAVTNTTMYWIFCNWRPKRVFHFGEVKADDDLRLVLFGPSTVPLLIGIVK